MPVIRPEHEGDRRAVRAVHEAAFPTSAEADLVDALRATDAWVPELSLVAEDGSVVVGHLLMSVAAVGDAEVLALAPMAVLPERQATGVGSALVRAGLQAATSTGHPLIIVLGHPGYYPRFGFTSARALGVLAPFEVPDEAWMAYALDEDTPRGVVTYPPPFAGV